jgi:hypothetical protein
MITSIHSRKEQVGEHMINGKNNQEEHRQNVDAEREELQQATKRFIRSMFRTGVSLALLPVNRLPQRSQRHFQVAGREFTHGLAALVHELAHGLEKMANDSNTLADSGESPDDHGKVE